MIHRPADWPDIRANKCPKKPVETKEEASDDEVEAAKKEKNRVKRCVMVRREMVEQEKKTKRNVNFHLYVSFEASRLSFERENEKCF